MEHSGTANPITFGKNGCARRPKRKMIDASPDVCMRYWGEIYMAVTSQEKTEA
jgi:hypothetical protein